MHALALISKNTIALPAESVPFLLHFGNKWCRAFHREYRETLRIDAFRTKVHCSCCDRTYIRERVSW